MSKFLTFSPGVALLLWALPVMPRGFRGRGAPVPLSPELEILFALALFAFPIYVVIWLAVQFIRDYRNERRHG